MRELYHPTQATRANFKDALYNDLGVYHIQRGAGIGGFFKSLFKTLAPIGKTILKTGFEIAKPHLQKAGNEIIETGTKAAVQKIDDFAQRKLARRQKRKTPYPADVFST